VAIEDSRWGLESARVAGLKTVGVTSAYDRAELGPYSDLIIASLADLDIADLRRLVH
jgi:beta-phosphoglucomutase-like phosphatase (HAD superfamily)